MLSLSNYWTYYCLWKGLGRVGHDEIMATQSLSKSFGEVVRANRSVLSFTQELLAERAGVHATYIGMVERGERNCSLDVASEIAKALNTSLSKLIEEAERRNQKNSNVLSRKGRRS